MREYIPLKIVYILSFLIIFSSSHLAAHNDSSSIKLYFNQGGTAVTNSPNLRRLNRFIYDNRAEVTHIVITGYSSPEGSDALNIELSKRRSEEVKKLLVTTMGLPDSLITVEHKGVAWDRLESLAQSQGAPYPSTDNHLIERIYPLLRYADVKLYMNIAPAEEQEMQAEVTEQEVVIAEVELPIEIEPTVEIEDELFTPQSSRDSKALFAIKTNLLFDAVSLINFEIEIPIRDRWSILAEYIFPWWVMENGKADSRRNRIEMLNGNIEGRYWWGDRAEREILTGWFTGAYVGIGMYDFEYHAKGYQGEAFVSVGLSGGYVHRIERTKSLRMEYSLGVGYLSTDYKHYHAEFCANEQWHAIEQHSGRYSWFGPTRAKVSLVWLINSREERR